MSDRVSIIIVTFNAKEVIRQSVQSILNQSYNNLELIVIDGASTDGTVDILKEFGKGITAWISEPDAGIYDAMNKGIHLATGKWILFLGADDQLCKGILNEIFIPGGNDSLDLVYGKINLDDSGKTIGVETNYQKMITYNVPHQAIFYKKTVLQKFNGYDLRYKILADYDLNLKIFGDPSLQKKFIGKEISIFCTRGVSNRTIDQLFFSEKLSYFITENGLSKNDKRLAKYYFFIGITMVLKKNYWAGFKNILHPVIFGGRRFHYFLLTGNFILTLIGVGRKFKYV